MVLQECNEFGGVAVDPVHLQHPADAIVAAPAEVVPERREQTEVQLRKPGVAARVGIARIMAEAGVPPGPDLGRAIVATAEVAPTIALDQVLAEHEQPRFVGLPGVDVFQEVIPLHVLDRVDTQRVHAHVEIAVDGADDIVLDVLPPGGEVDAVAGQVLGLQRMGALPVAAADEPVLVVPFGIEVVGVDAEEASGVVAGLGHRLAGFGIHQRHLALRIHGVALAVPLRRDRVVDVVAVRPCVVAEVALIGAMVHPALLGALRHVVLDGKVVDPDLAADTVLTGMVDHHVLDDLDAAGVGLVDEILIGGVGGLEPGVDARPVEGVITVVVEAAPVFHRRGDPDGGEAEIADVVETLDQALEIATPVRILGLAGDRVELDAVTAEEVVGRVAVIEPRGEQEIDGLLAEVE